MGLPGMGVFFVVLFRSLVIGVLAALLCMLVGLVLGQFLAADLSEVELFIWKPVITVALGISDYLLIAAGAILCAALGSIMPAIRASRLDPFDAIMEGQFN
jgi:ABC-type lipoprotein release transport system permease subunit